MIDEFIAWADGHDTVSSYSGNVLGTYTLVWRRGDVALFYDRTADGYEDISHDAYKKIEFYREVVYLPGVTTGNGFCANMWRWDASFGEDYQSSRSAQVKLSLRYPTPMEATKASFGG
jgi:hypothetical protein